MAILEAVHPGAYLQEWYNRRRDGGIIEVNTFHKLRLHEGLLEEYWLEFAIGADGDYCTLGGFTLAGGVCSRAGGEGDPHDGGDGREDEDDQVF